MGSFSFTFSLCTLYLRCQRLPFTVGSSDRGAVSLCYLLARSDPRRGTKVGVPSPAPLGSPRDPPRPRRCLDGPRSVCRRRSEAVPCPRVRVRQTPSEAGREASGHLPRLCLSPGRREEVGKYAAPQEPPAGRSQPHAAALRSGPVALCGTGFRCRSWLVGARISA